MRKTKNKKCDWEELIVAPLSFSFSSVGWTLVASVSRHLRAMRIIYILYGTVVVVVSLLEKYNGARVALHWPFSYLVRLLRLWRTSLVKTVSRLFFLFGFLCPCFCSLILLKLLVLSLIGYLFPIPKKNGKKNQSFFVDDDLSRLNKRGDIIGKKSAAQHVERWIRFSNIFFVFSGAKRQNVRWCVTHKLKGGKHSSNSKIVDDIESLKRFCFYWIPRMTSSQINMFATPFNNNTVVPRCCCCNKKQTAKCKIAKPTLRKK